MSKTFTVSKAGFDNKSVLVSDGTVQTAMAVKEGIMTLEEFLAEADVENWTENQLDIFKGSMFQDLTGRELGTFEVPYIITT